MTAKTKPVKSYRQLSDELAELLAWFEAGDVELEEAIENYKKATELIKQMEDYLQNAQNEIKKLTVTRGRKQ